MAGANPAIFPDPSNQALTDQIAALDRKWTGEFRGLKRTVATIRKAQTEIKGNHSAQSRELGVVKEELLDIQAEMGRFKPLTEAEQQALANLVSTQLAQQIIRRWVGTMKGRVAAAAAALAIAVTLVSSLASLFRHGF
ncbi:MAG: hypothetical protein M0T72_08285 [Candidatus Dormibacteraeota bacterium]|nr:hypothetical protein [Candidatus Dormibacteraeota bacterium]